MADPIERIETYCLELPYRRPVHFHSVTEDRGQYLVLRALTRSGAEGIAESVCRPAQTGDTPAELAAEVATHLVPLLSGADACDDGIFASLWAAPASAAAKAICDVALWDLRARLQGVPAWKLLGPGPAKPVPVAWIVHGNSAAEQVDEAVRAVTELGFSALKLKTWRRSMEDVEMVRAVREAVGQARIIWIDCNGSYTPDEARAILPHMAEFGISFIEDPCEYGDLGALAALARDLPVPILGDKPCQDFAGARALIEAGAAGALSVKMRRTGVSEALKIIAFAADAGAPVILGTDSESRIGALARVHLRAAIPSLDPWPTETHFFAKLADDVFAGDFRFEGGRIVPPDAPGFGAGLDMSKLLKLAA